jgi:uracil-DNA glycosylase
MHNIATSTSAAVSLIGWWQDAGVDIFVDEMPVPWLERAKPTAAKPTAKVTAHPESQPTRTNAPLPDSVSALTTWLMSDPDIPEAGPVSRRIAASGAEGAALMIMIDMPEANDHQAGALLSGECATLFENMLKAIGQNRNSVYIAALCPGRPVTGRLSDAALPQLAEIARQHIALCVPKRLWLLGSTVSRALLGVDDVASVGNLHDFNHEAVNIPTVASFAPRFLLEHPAQKARVWADMQVLIKGI